MDEGVELDPGFDNLIAGLDATDQVRFGLGDGDQAGPVLALADNPGRSIRELEHLENQAHADHREKIVHPGRVCLGMELADQADHPLTNHAVINQANAAGPIDHERNDGLRKDHVGSQWQKRDITRLQRLIGVPLRETMSCPGSDLEPPGVAGTACFSFSALSSGSSPVFFVDAWISFLRYLSDRNRRDGQPILAPVLRAIQGFSMIVHCRGERKR